MKNRIVIFLTLSLIATLIFFNFTLPDYHESVRPIKQVKIDENISDLKGKSLAYTICKHCHYNAQFGTLAGRQHGNPSKFGQFYSGNITQDTLYGIGKWSDESLFYFLKTGIKPDGSYVFDMPKYPNLSDEDLLSLIAFLKGSDPLVKATHYPNPAPEYSFLTRVLLWVWLRPVEWDTTFNPPVDTSNSVSWGRYLATAKYSCFECHSGNAMLNNYKYPEKSWKFFKGGNPHADEEGNKVVAPALVPLKTDWDANDFINTLRTGYRPDGRILRNPMIPFAVLSDREAGAIYDYLKHLELNETD